MKWIDRARKITILLFLPWIPFGHIYLRDGSDLIIRQYSIEGFYD